MQKRKLGKNGPCISALGLGCMSLSESYEPERDEVESIALIQDAYSKGINFFDTAAVYADGKNEQLLGKALRSVFDTQRDSVVIATKCGINVADWTLDLKPESIIASCNRSLKNLGLSYVDLFYLHRLPGTKAGFEASLDALLTLLESNKIRGIGLSEANAESIQFAYDYLKHRGHESKFLAVQNEFSLLHQFVKRNKVLDTCNRLGLALIAYSPLSRALLAPSDKINLATKFEQGDVRPMFPRFQGDEFKQNLATRDELAKLAAEKNCSLPQMALAWVLAQAENVIPLFGTRKKQHLEDNLASVNIILNRDDLARIEAIAKGGSKALPYPEAVLEMHNAIKPPIGQSPLNY